MIDCNLRKEMEQAFLEGRYEDALKLSQKLDIQIFQVTKTLIKPHESILSRAEMERSQS